MRILHLAIEMLEEAVEDCRRKGQRMTSQNEHARADTRYAEAIKLTQILNLLRIARIGQK